MHYDPIKDIFASVIRKSKFLRISFYKLLDLFFLRAWYVHRELLNIRSIFGNRKIEILDAGSGYGQYSYFMVKNISPCEITAVDVKKEWLNDCSAFFSLKGYSNISFGQKDLLNLEYNNKFDLIVCIDVMEHIVEDVKVFENYSKALKKGGFLLINTPSIFGGSDAHDDEDESFIGEHARNGYSYEDLTEKLKPLSLKPFSAKYSYRFWGDLYWRLIIKYPIMIVNKVKAAILLLPFYYLIFFPIGLIFMTVDFALSKNIDKESLAVKKGSGIIYVAQKQ